MIIIDTNGWDIIYVCSNDSINKRLRDYMKQNEIKISYSDSNAQINLIFDPWKITHGGSGKLLRIKTPVKKGNLVLKNKSISLDGVCPLIEIQLGFLDNGIHEKIKILTFDFLVKGNSPGDSTNGAVTIVDTDLNQIIKNPFHINILENILPNMFIENKNKFSYIFAQINLSPEERWMKPEKYIYSYVNRINKNDGFLAVFSVVTNRNMPQLNCINYKEILNEKNSLFLLLSERMLLENIILPELASSLGNGAKSIDFKFNEISETSGEIININTLKSDCVKVGDSYYYPKITKLKIKIKDSVLVTTVSGKIELKGVSGSYIIFDTQSINKFAYDKAHKRVYFIPDSEPYVDYKIHMHNWKWDIPGLNWIALIIAQYVANNILKNISKYVNLQSSKYLEKLSNDVVCWNNIKDMKICDIILDGNLGIQGNLKESTILNNLIENGSFESGNLQGWEYKKVKIINDSDINKNVIDINEDGDIYQNKFVEKNAYYNISIKVKTNENSYGELLIEELGKFLIGSKEINNSNNFQKVDYTFNTEDFDFIDVKVKCKYGEIFATDFVLKKVDNLMKNGDFLTGDLKNWRSNSCEISVLNVNDTMKNVVYINKKGSISQKINVKEDTNYKVSVKIRTSKNTIAELQIANEKNFTIGRNEITHEETFIILDSKFNTGKNKIISIILKNKNINKGAIIGTNFILEEIR